ncbi:MAG: N-acetyltransferase [Nitrospiraceae bacterium]|nr:MAG: N-acetyltransferase [Nitrospiraceae bacterium]
MKEKALKLRIEKAVIKDAKTIHAFVNQFARKDEMLPRSLNEIYENIRDFFKCLDDGKIVGVAALHILWEDLAEIRSVAVSTAYQGKGIGKKLVKKCIVEAQALGLEKVFALTYQPGFFRELGFHDVDKNALPQKIWGECLKCHKFPECNELAVIKEL